MNYELRKILNPKQIQITEIQRFKNGFRIECGMTDVGLILFGGRFLHFAMLRIASVGMTRVGGRGRNDSS
ncbi:MAG: hypothetical protein ACYS32_17455 [Planctomycetota bacterium]